VFINIFMLLLGLLENPDLLERELFPELLWAVFHPAEELSHRTTIEGLPDTDYEHFKSDYPYLFSLAVRTNPFDPNALVKVK